MSLEDLLRDAYQAKAGQLTEARLDELAAARAHGLAEQAREDGLAELPGVEHTAELPVITLSPRSSRRHRWVAPVLAAAAVAAVAIGAVVVATSHGTSEPRPNPPATHVSSPPTNAATPSQSSAAPSHSIPSKPSQVTLPYLPSGQTGSRGQVPWPIVGSGWQLLQVAGSRSLYLYDPAAGRYLITDELPAGARLTGWSPNVRQAFITVIPNPLSSRGIYYQVDLTTGRSAKEMTKTSQVIFMAYSPDGTDYLVQEDSGQILLQLALYGTHGIRRTSFPTSIGNTSLSAADAVFSSTGDQVIIGGRTVGLFGLDGHLIRTFVKPAGASECGPVKMWGNSSVLENCLVGDGWGRDILIVQPLSGEKPSALVSGYGSSGFSFSDAWPLSDGSLLLAGRKSCSDNSPGYYIQRKDGSVRYLQGPPTAANGIIRSLQADTVTYQGGAAACREYSPATGAVVQYNLRTGKSIVLSAQPAYLAPWQADAG